MKYGRPLVATHKRGMHYSKEEMVQILGEHLSERDAKAIANAICDLPYIGLDNLHDAIEVIRRGTGIMERETYILTDGINVYKERKMTLDEFDDANANCDIHTAGNVWWELKSGGRA